MHIYISFSIDSFVKLAAYLLAQPRCLIALRSLLNVLKIFSAIQRTDMFELSPSKDGWAH